MIYLIGGMALVISLIALWLSGDAVRRMSDRMTGFVDSHVSPLRGEVDGWRRDAGAAAARLDAAEAAIKDLVNRAERAESALKELRAEVAASHAQVEALVNLPRRRA